MNNDHYFEDLKTQNAYILQGQDNTKEKRAGFTQGPFHVQLLSESKKLPYAIINDNIDVIARVHSEPDAHLLASAPALHEALQNILTEFDAYEEAMCRRFGAGHEDYGRQRELARLALAKANGRAEG